MEFENKAKAAEKEGDYLTAIKYYFQALESLKEMKLVEGLQYDSGNILHRIANLYTEIGNFDTAIKYFKEAIHYFIESEEPLTKIYRLVGECYASIGACYLTASNYKTALEPFQKALENFEKAAELEEQILRKYVIEREIFIMGLYALSLIILKKIKNASPFLQNAITLIKDYNVYGLATNIILFLNNIINKNYSEARVLLQEKIEDAADASLFTSTLQATVMGLIIDLASKHIPEARIQIQDQIIEEKGEVILTTKIFQDMLLYGLCFANKKMPRAEYKEVMGLIIGKIKKDDVIVTEIVPMTSGSEVEVEFKNKHYTKAAMIDSMAAERNEFIVGWYHTHPELGLFLSPTDIINQLGYQALNEKAIAIVFDFTKMTPLKPGFSIFRLDNTSLGQASNFHSVRWRIKDASNQIFAESISFFDKFLLNLNALISDNRQLTLSQLAEQLNRSETFLGEIIPHLIELQYLPNIQFDSTTKTISLKG